MSANNFRMIPYNCLDDGIVTSSPVAVSTLPESYLQRQERNMLARWLATATDILITWPTNQRIDSVALGRHNLTTGGTYRSFLYSDAAWTTQIDDSTALAAYDISQLSQIDQAKYTSTRFRGFKNSAYYRAAGVLTNVRSAKIQLSDASLSALDLSRIFIGERFEATYSVPASGGLSLGLDGGTVAKRTEGGSLVSDKKAEWRTLKLNPDKIVEAGDLKNFLSHARHLHKHSDFWFDFFPGDVTAQAIYHRGGFKFTDLGALEPHFYGLAKQNMVMEEA